MTENETQPDPVTKVARDLREIEDLSAQVLTQAVHKANDQDMPGGNAMVALAGVANLEAWQHQIDTALRVAYDRGDELPEIDDEDDHEPPLQTLRFWTEQLRAEHGDDYDQRYTIASEVNYLRHMLNWLWENEVHWDDFAKDVRKARVRLENLLYAGRRVERTRVTCNAADCEKRPRLIVIRARKYIDDVRDFELTDHWKCPACKTRYDEDDYQRAYAEQLRSQGAERYVGVADAIGTLKALGRSERTIRKWFGSCEVKAHCDATTRTVWVWWPDLWTLHVTTPTRRRGKVA